MLKHRAVTGWKEYSQEDISVLRAGNGSRACHTFYTRADWVILRVAVRNWQTLTRCTAKAQQRLNALALSRDYVLLSRAFTAWDIKQVQVVFVCANQLVDVLYESHLPS